MLNFLYNPNGRVSRRQIWLFFLLPYMAISFFASLIDAALISSQLSGGGKSFGAPAMFGLLVSLFYFWPSIAVPVKRFHDRGMSGWWLLAFVIGGVAAFFGALWSVFGAAFSAAAGAPNSQHAMTDAAERLFAYGLPPDATVLLIVGFAIIVIQFVILYLLPGQDGPNRFGADPRGGYGGPSEASTERLSGSWAGAEASMAAARPGVFEYGGNASPEKPAAVTTLRRGDFMGGSQRPSFGRRGG